MDPTALPALLTQLRVELADVPRAPLGEIVTPRMLGIPRAPRVVLRDEVWHLGVVLLGTEAVYATGEIVRSREPARRGYTAQSQRTRAALAEAVYRGGVLPGTPVHLGWRVLDPAEVAAARHPSQAIAPFAVVDGDLRLRWSAAGGYADAAAYLHERADLLLDPPRGAT